MTHMTDNINVINIRVHRLCDVCDKELDGYKMLIEWTDGSTSTVCSMACGEAAQSKRKGGA